METFLGRLDGLRARTGSVISETIKKHAFGRVRQLKTGGVHWTTVFEKASKVLL